MACHHAGRWGGRRAHGSLRGRRLVGRHAGAVAARRPSLVAVASPLVATIPGATIAAVPYVRSGDARPKAAAWSLLGAVPATIVGALLSRLVGGPALLVASGVVLVVVGVRVLLPIEDRGSAKRVPAGG